jgi:hypothetical protein
MPILVRLFSIAALLCCWDSSLHLSGATLSNSPSILGTWKGESICVGNQPACKDEVVVYLFEAIPGRPDRVMLYGDKIIEGQRVPMGKLEFQYDESKGTLSCEFTARRANGLWQFTNSGDTMEGTLILLPGKELVRQVKVKRVSADQVPAPPDKKLYDGD